jgi:hypothetical protein
MCIGIYGVGLTSIGKNISVKKWGNFLYDYFLIRGIDIKDDEFLSKR